MEIEIVHCNSCGNRPRAASLAAKIAKELGVRAAIAVGTRDTLRT